LLEVTMPILLKNILYVIFRYLFVQSCQLSPTATVLFKNRISVIGQLLLYYSNAIM